VIFTSGSATVGPLSSIRSEPAPVGREATRHVRSLPQVTAVQLNQVEGVQKYAAVCAVVSDEVERGNAVLIAGDSFPVDDTGARAQARQRLGNEREAVGEIIAWTAVEPHLAALLAGNDAEAIVLEPAVPEVALISGRDF
jgi:hypothetical protein